MELLTSALTLFFLLHYPQYRTNVNCYVYVCSNILLPLVPMTLNIQYFHRLAEIHSFSDLIRLCCMSSNSSDHVNSVCINSIAEQILTRFPLAEISTFRNLNFTHYLWLSSSVPSSFEKTPNLLTF